MRRTFESFLIRADEEKEPRRVVAGPEERTGASYIFLGINFNIPHVVCIHFCTWSCLLPTTKQTTSAEAARVTSRPRADETFALRLGRGRVEGVPAHSDNSTANSTSYNNFFSISSKQTARERQRVGQREMAFEMQPKWRRIRKQTDC